MRIGELSKKSGFSKDTIRFYEKLGLIPLQDAHRNKYQFKDYPEAMLRRLLAIREIKSYGFTLQEILGMLILFEEGVLEAERAVRFVQRKIDRVDRKIREMITIKSKLQEIVDHNTDGHCPIEKLLHGMSDPVSI